MSKLNVNLAGLELKNPITIASSPLTAKLELLKEAEDNGASSVSIKHTMLVQAFQARPRWYYNPSIGVVVSGDPRLDPEYSCNLIRQAKEQTDLKLFSNMSGAPNNLSTWGDLAKMLQDAGTDGIELNFNCPNLMSAGQTQGAVGSNLGANPEACAMVVKEVKSKVSIPVMVKLSTESGVMPKVAKACMDAGADILNVHAGFRAAPGIDIYNGGKFLYPGSEAGSFGGHTGVYSRMASNRFIADMAKQHPGSALVGGSGLVTWDHIIEAVMFGAYGVQMCTEVMHHGFGIVKKCVEGMERFLDEQGYNSLDDIRGISLKYITAPNQMVYKDVAAHVQEDKCVGCKLCTKIAHCVAIDYNAEFKKCSVNPDKCIGCGFCLGVCPKKAIEIVEK